MRSLLACPLLALVVGCATAAPAGSDDDIILVPDARVTSDGRAPDARPIDAAPVDAPPALTTITLNQTGAQTVTALASVACSDQATLYTRDNSYYRVFRLADFGINRPFTPSTVTFGVEQATAGFGGSQTVQVKLYTLNGALTLANMVNVAGNNVAVPDSGISIVNAPIAPAPIIQPGATLVVEVFSPDGNTVGNIFYIGANNGTETAPGYLRSDACGVAQPTPYSALGLPNPNIRLVLTVTGTY